MVKNHSIKNLILLLICLFSFPKIASNKDYVNSKLPQHMVTGYWHNFWNGSTNLKLRDVPSYYDMICVAFTGNTGTPGEVTFELDSYLASLVGGYTKQQFIQDIKDLKSKGQHVIISVGGANGAIIINSDAASDKFASSLSAIIKEYGFEGVDIDLEGSAVSGTAYLARGLRKLHDEFGDDFIITMAPETYYMHKANDLTGAYYRLAIDIKDILTICYPQFYNAGGDIGYNNFNARYPSQSFITSLATMYIENGLRPDQMAIGVPALPSGAGSGYISIDDLKAVINSLVYKKPLDGFTPPREYKTLRGVMTWSINWDGTQNYVWGKSMSELMDSLPVVDGGIERPEHDDDDNSDNNGNDDNSDNNNNDNSDNNNSDDYNNNDQQDVGDIPGWKSNSVYFGGDKVVYNGKIYQALWWTQGDNPEEQGALSPWKYICDASGNSDPDNGNNNDNSDNNDNGDNSESDNNDNSDNNNSDDNNNNDQQDVGEISGWKSSIAYFSGDKVVYNGKIYQALWWTQGDNPEEQEEFGPWKYIGEASGNSGNSDNNNDNNNDQQDLGEIPSWKSSTAYFSGDKVVYNGKIYQALWWTKGDNPEEQGELSPWKYIGEASGNSGNNDDDNNNNNDQQQDVGDIPSWNASTAYFSGDKVVYNGKIYQALWWTKGENPEEQGESSPWKYIGEASSNSN